MASDVAERSGIRPEELENLRSQMRGRLLMSNDHGYDAARSLHNGMIDRHPAAIAACSGVADVMHALEFAVKKSVPLSIKCGGHGLPGFAVCDGGLMIDLSAMAAVSVDPAAKLA